MKWILTVFLTLGVTLGSVAQASNLWAFWDVSDSASTQVVDHSAWQQFLDTYLQPDRATGVTLVRYADVTEADHEALRSYIRRLERVPVRSLSRDEQYAYWFNVYNALTVLVILDHYPVNSIRDINISPGLFSRGPWGAKLMEVEGQELSLDDVEHRILRPIWKDPRIHYGVNCASIGCPNLQPLAFTAANVDGLLEAGAVEFINNPRGATVRNGRAMVSSIYTWFQEDFEGNAQGVLDHLKIYAEPELREQLESASTRLRFEYDWSLNAP